MNNTRPQALAASRRRLLGRSLAVSSALLTAFVSAAAVPSRAEIPKPNDAPRPQTPAQSATMFRVPDGFRLELIASEPLITEPSGVCWDERGRLFVCELHGYNLEGQYDIEELNKTGQLDRVVRRLPANDAAKRAAHADTFGTVKQLTDTDGDGRLDKAAIWADRLPPCYGLCPARGGVIVVCAPDIVFLADPDNDGRAEVREVLFTGFVTGAIERAVSCPLWGLDDWIYLSRGHGGTITGPKLAQPVKLSNTDFRIRADGSAIEPISGSTGTIGATFTEEGDRFVINTQSPGIQVAPLPWASLARNPDVATPELQRNAVADNRCFPTSQPHPWRAKRADDPAFAKFYTDRYGVAESAPNGYFTSACSPFIYQDSALPGMRGQLLACEPAQNLVHRALVDRDGVLLNLRRPAAEERTEFLTSTDSWFHPIALSQAPDGSIFIVDFYREIIEDYSAIPRYLQQQYGLVNGREFGRIWRLTHRESVQAPLADMGRLVNAELVVEVASPHAWRRQTARRLLIERRADDAISGLEKMLDEREEPAVVLNALYTLAGIQQLKTSHLVRLLSHVEPGVRVHALRLAEPSLDHDSTLLREVFRLMDDASPRVLLQLGMTLGATSDKQAIAVLTRLVRQHGDIPWMTAAVLSSLRGRCSNMLEELVGKGLDAHEHIDTGFLAALGAAIGSRRDSPELSQALVTLAETTNRGAQLAALRGLRNSFKSVTTVKLTDDARAAAKRLAVHQDADTRAEGLAIVALLRIESDAERNARLTLAQQRVADIRQPAELRLAAVAELSAEADPAMTSVLLAAIDDNTPQVREAILNAVVSRRDRLPLVIDALEARTFSPSALSAVQRAALAEHPDAGLRERAAALFRSSFKPDDATFSRFVSALKNSRQPAHGEQVFREKCGNCHQAHGVGSAVGPDLSAEFQRAEETIIQDILAPSASITAGYSTYTVVTTDGRIVTGLVASESASSITLKQPQGKLETVLRKDIEEFKATSISLMPEDLVKSVSPQDVVDVIAWLRIPSSCAVLLDDNESLAAALHEGAGIATFVADDAHSGRISLHITPPQRFSARINGWQFRIRKNPGPGEFRYLRFAWKSAGATGVMIELADNGNWPDAQSVRCRYFAGKNTSGWEATEVSPTVPKEWVVVTRDLWNDFGDSTLTGFAPTAMGGPALFDRIELLRNVGPTASER